MHALVRTAFVLALLVGCDEQATRPTRPIDASLPKPPAPPAREGCVRSGSLDGVETDPTCIVKQASEDAMRSIMKSLVIALEVHPAEVVTGGTANLEISIRNTSSSEVTVLFEGRSRPPGARTDWSRVAGIPEPSPNASETNRLFFQMTTTDGYDRDIDAVPTVAGSLGTSAPTLFAVHLKPGSKLTRVLSWWALSIPAPAPIVKDDAGHRYVPKTTALHLAPGTYNVAVDLPLYGLEREERKVTGRVRVLRVPPFDAGAPPAP